MGVNGLCCGPGESRHKDASQDQRMPFSQALPHGPTSSLLPIVMSGGWVAGKALVNE